MSVTLSRPRSAGNILLSYQNGALLTCFQSRIGNVKSNLSNRGAVHGFSVSASGRMRRYLRTCTADYSYIGTLTYPAEFPIDGRECKQHLKRFVQRYRRAVQHHRSADKWSFFWFLEFQQRGAPHFHFFTTHEPALDISSQFEGDTIKATRAWIARTWYDIVGSGDERHLRAGTQFDPLRSGRPGTVSYAAKYAAKHAQKEVPDCMTNVGRFWGVSGLRDTMSADMVLDAADYLHPNVRHLMKNFKWWMESMERNGEVRIKRHFDGRIKAVFAQSERAKSKLWAKFCLLRSNLSFEIAVKTYDPPIFDILTGWPDDIYEQFLTGERELMPC